MSVEFFRVLEDDLRSYLISDSETVKELVGGVIDLIERYKQSNKSLTPTSIDLLDKSFRAYLNSVSSSKSINSIINNLTIINDCLPHDAELIKDSSDIKLVNQQSRAYDLRVESLFKLLQVCYLTLGSLLDDDKSVASARAINDFFIKKKYSKMGVDSLYS